LVMFVCLFSLLTLFAYPDSDTPVEQARPLAWWQFRFFALIGLILSGLPSGAVFYLDGFFQRHEQLRNPFVISVLAGELAVVSYVAYCLVRRMAREA